MHPLDLGLQFVPHGLLQGLALGRAFHQSLVGFRDPLNLQLQLGRECEMVSLGENLDSGLFQLLITTVELISHL